MHYMLASAICVLLLYGCKTIPVIHSRLFLIECAAAAAAHAVSSAAAADDDAAAAAASKDAWVAGSDWWTARHTAWHGADGTGSGAKLWPHGRFRYELEKPLVFVLSTELLY